MFSLAHFHPITLNKSVSDIEIGGCSLRQLANDHGTPLFVIDGKTIDHMCQKYQGVINAVYPKSHCIFASKAHLSKKMAQRIHGNNFGFDVVSGGELYTCLKAGVNGENIYFHGNNKSFKELKFAIENQVTIIIDNVLECQRICDISLSLNQSVDVMCRVKPAIDVDTHEYIKTGQDDSKFGLNSKDLTSVLTLILESSQVNYVGIHAHLGSQLFDKAPFLTLVDYMVQSMTKINNDFGFETTKVNFGGGFGIPYLTEDQFPQFEDIISSMLTKFMEVLDGIGVALPLVIFEPGRSVVANAGVTVYSVGAIKEVSESKAYVCVDGGMTDNPRPMMYQSKYEFDAITDNQTGDSRLVSVAGKFCESSDILGDNVSLPVLKEDDLIVVYATGAYNYSMSSNYNRACRPPVVCVDDGTCDVFVRRETYDDLMSCDL